MSSIQSPASVESLTRAGRDRPRVPMPPAKWKTRIALPGLILAMSLGLLIYTGAESLRPAVDVEVVPVVLKAGAAGTESRASTDGAAEPAAGAVAAQAPGWIEPDPFPINVPALANGVVKEVLVLEGERIEEGQLIARLVDDDARLELQRAEAEAREKMAMVIIAEADKMEARLVWENRIELNRALAVAQATLDEVRAQLARLPLEVEAQAARLEELRDDLRRKEDLVAKRAVPEADVAQLRQRVKAQAADLDAAKAMRPILEAKVKTWQAEVTAAQENLRLRIRDTRMMAAANAAFEAAKAAAARAETMREEARLRLSRMDIRSPVAGVVMTRLVEPGSKLMLEMDDPSSSWVIRVYDPGKLQVRVDVPLVSAGSLGVGMPAEITVEALPGRTFTGRVTRLVHEANIQKNTVQVKVAIDDPAPELKPEMLTRVKLFRLGSAPAPSGSASTAAPSGAATGMLMAPAALLLAGADGIVAGAAARAWVVDQATSEATQREVRIGSHAERTREGAEWVQIIDGLNPGDRLIAGDTSRLRDGVKVRVVGERTGGGHGVH